MSGMKKLSVVRGARNLRLPKFFSNVDDELQLFKYVKNLGMV